MRMLGNKGSVKIGKLTLTTRKIVNICVILVTLIAIVVFASVIDNEGSVKCPTCLGDGTILTTEPECEFCGGDCIVYDNINEEIVDCPVCKGEGVTEVDKAVRVTCPDCGGDRVLKADSTCPDCHGAGKVMTKTPVCKKCKGAGSFADLESGTFILCPDCAGNGYTESETEVLSSCTKCEGTGVIKGAEPVNNRYYGTFVSLLPPIIAILLALLTKEVYSSLFVGIFAGALFNGGFKFSESMDAMVSTGLMNSISIGIIVFLVILGIMVALVNKSGGAEAFGRWAKTHIKTKVGASLATFFLGILIFIDDYFNCLTVGSVMKPVTDSKKVSREKLAYLIDATAAPICMIAPISSWAAAVSSTAKQVNQNGIKLFVHAIPYNFYSLLTIVMVLALIFLRVDFGPMKNYERAAELMNSTDGNEPEKEPTPAADAKVNEPVAPAKKGGRVIDIVLPIVTLIICCVIGMLYSGGFFVKGDNKWKLIGAFGDSDATIGLPWGSLIALVLTIIYLIARRRITFKESMECIPKGFIAMVPAILILTFAWALNTMTSELGAAGFVGNLMKGSSSGLVGMLPAIIFLVALGLAFATGTSWGTFGILIPIVVAVFGPSGGEILVIGISACLAGAVCGDHCSPISDTTIMASAGAECNHVNHVSTQLPYALTVAGVSFICFILAGFIKMWYVVLPIGILLMVGTVIGIKYLQKFLEKKAQAASSEEQN